MGQDRVGLRSCHFPGWHHLSPFELRCLALTWALAPCGVLSRVVTTLGGCGKVECPDGWCWLGSVWWESCCSVGAGITNLQSSGFIRNRKTKASQRDCPAIWRPLTPPWDFLSLHNQKNNKQLEFLLSQGSFKTGNALFSWSLVVVTLA